MKLGFTGTRNGMSARQKVTFAHIMLAGAESLHHGACQGADEDAALLCSYRALPVRLIAHPGESAKGGVNEFLSVPAITASHEVRETKTHFARNRDIVDETDSLIAAPWQRERPAPKAGGGTWYTVEYAEKKGKPITIIWPNGTVTQMGAVAAVPS